MHTNLKHITFCMHTGSRRDRFDLECDCFDLKYDSTWYLQGRWIRAKGKILLIYGDYHVNENKVYLSSATWGTKRCTFFSQFDCKLNIINNCIFRFRHYYTKSGVIKHFLGWPLTEKTPFWLDVNENRPHPSLHVGCMCAKMALSVLLL